MIGNAQLCILIQPRGSRSWFISITSPTLSLLSEELFVPGLWSPSLGCEGYLVSPISPSLFSLCFSHLCSTSPSSRIRGDGEEVVRGVVLWSRNNVPLDVAGAPELPVLGTTGAGVQRLLALLRWASRGCDPRPGWGASSGGHLFIGFRWNPSQPLPQNLDDGECFSPPSDFWWWIKSLPIFFVFPLQYSVFWAKLE